MKQATLKALKESIRHWWRVSQGDEASNGVSGCALCGRFYKDKCVLRGEKCPVFERTGTCLCLGSPYSIFEENIGIRTLATTEFEQGLALKELEFLVSLLPAGESVVIDGWEWYAK